MVNPNKTKSQENAEHKQHFKELISRLNFISEREEESIPLREVPATPKNKLLEGKRLDESMKDIIGRFNSMIEETIKPILMEEHVSGELELAVKTKPTEKGVQIGDWEITKLEENGFLSYDISSVETKKTILEDIKTYVAANAIVRLLNLGEPINGEQIKKFLRLDEDFDINYQDALRYKRKFKKTGEEIYEHRYQNCKGKALQLKETIKKNLDMIGNR